VSFLSLSTDSVAQAYPEAPVVVAGDKTVPEVLQLMRAAHASCVIVCEGERLAGIFTERDALRWMAEPGKSDSRLSERMARHPVALRENDSVGHAIELMSEGGYRHLPIVDAKNSPRGVLAVRGIVHYLIDHFPQTIYNLPPEPGRAPASREGA
jgi:CBS domain-containing protein